MGIHTGHFFDTAGNPISEEEFNRRRDEWLPSQADKDYIKSLMVQELEPGKIANWVAPPARGINGKPFDFEYIRKV
jgi:benzoyl-CoA 2,3-dioxygenase component B